MDVGDVVFSQHAKNPSLVAAPVADNNQLSISKQKKHFLGADSAYHFKP